MFIYIIWYLVVSFFLLLEWQLIYKRYKKNWSWKFFLFFIVLVSLWLFLYFLSYSLTYNRVALLYLSRLLYSLTIPAFYSILIFFLSFNNEKSNNKKYNSFFIIYFFCFFILFSLFSPYVVEDMVLDSNSLVFYEKYWIFYYFYQFLYFLVFPFFVLLVVFKLKTLKTINRIRFQLLWLGFIILLLLSVLFLVILPVNWIFILQKEVFLFFLPFIILSWYSIYRYYYMDFKLWISILLIYISSILLSWLSSFSLYKLYFYYVNNLDTNILHIWNQSLVDSNTELILFYIIGLILYNIYFHYLKIFFLWKKWNNSFVMEVLKLKNEIPFISSIDDLNSFLYNRFNNSFKVKCEIVLCNKENRDYWEIRKFFSKEKLNNYFINDIVFIEENSNKFDKVKILKEIKKDYYLVFPILNKNFELVWLFYVWKKLLNDAYYSNEVDALRDFVDFLSGHLKYIRMYDRINDLNINLDKMIDDKTMQYNTLLNRQKDFISLISHEIKWPIWSAIFQVDSLLDDINDNSKIKTSYIKGELDLLNQQLLNVWELANRIFSIEKYDIWNISLLKEKLKINDLIFSEVEMYKKNNENIKITFEFDDKIRFVTLDKVQIIQVVNNLINNAIKFSSNWNSTPEVIVLTYKNWDYFYLEVHDNWTEFEYTNVSKFFDKYTTWKWSSIWLWMGLYLCKRIVELHDWFILAEVSEKLGWAKFLIKLPL